MKTYTCLQVRLTREHSRIQIFRIKARQLREFLSLVFSQSSQRPPEELCSASTLEPAGALALAELRTNWKTNLTGLVRSSSFLLFPVLRVGDRLIFQHLYFKMQSFLRRPPVSWCCINKTGPMSVGWAPSLRSSKAGTPVCSDLRPGRDDRPEEKRAENKTRNRRCFGSSCGLKPGPDRDSGSPFLPLWDVTMTRARGLSEPAHTGRCEPPTLLPPSITASQAARHRLICWGGKQSSK